MAQEILLGSLGEGLLGSLVKALDPLVKASLANLAPLAKSLLSLIHLKPDTCHRMFYGGHPSSY